MLATGQHRALLGPLSPPPLAPPLLVAGYSGCIHTGPTQRAQQNQSQGPGSLLMQGAEQQKAETTTLERALLGDHIYIIYWVYTAVTSVSAG